MKFMKVTEFYLKWVHMARYELILKLNGALWLKIISKPLLTPQTAMARSKIHAEYKIRIFSPPARAPARPAPPVRKNLGKK